MPPTWRKNWATTARQKKKKKKDGEAERIRRVTFNEITQRAVREAFEHPRDIDQNLVDAQQARRVLDRLVGYQVSPLLWDKVRRGSVRRPGADGCVAPDRRA